MQDGSRKAILAALAANLGIAVSKLVGFVLTGAASLAAESVHSFADTGNQALLLLGSKRSRREASETHPFGFGRERFFWAFIVSLVLFSMGGLFAIYEGIDKLQHPHELDDVTVAIGILLVAVVLETFSLRTAVKESNHVRRSESWWTFIRRSRNPELPIVLLEDVGAEIGLLFALTGVVLAKVTGNARWDAAGSLGIGILLVIVAIILAIEMKSLLIGESARSDDVAAIKAAVEATPNIRKVIHLRTLHMGPEDLFVGIKVDMDRDLSFAEVAATIDAAEARIRTSVPAAHTIYMEPDCEWTPS